MTAAATLPEAETPQANLSGAKLSEAGAAGTDLSRTSPPEAGLPVAFGFLELSALRRHEQTVAGRLAALTSQISRDGELRRPVLVDRHSLVILDGHHRARALEALGCVLVPVYLVDYLDPGIAVFPRRADFPVTKETVVATGLSGRPYPPRTSRHVLERAPGERPTPLERLRP